MYSSLRIRVCKPTIFTLLIAAGLMPQLLQSQVSQFKIFGVDEGLSTSHVTDLQSDSKGYIWLTTYGAGISRFDGNQFVNFADPLKIGGLYFYTLMRDADALWFGGEKVLAQFEHDRWNYSGFEFDIYHIARFSDTHLLLCTSKGMMTYGTRAKDLLPFGQQMGATFQSVAHQKVVWVVSASGLWRYTRDKWMPYDQAGFMADEESLLAVDGQNTLWLTTRKQGLMRWDGVRFSTVANAADLPGNSIRTLTPAALGAMYMGTDAGLVVWQSIDSTWQRASDAEIPLGEITGMVYDAWDNAYIASSDHGLIQYATQDFILYEGTENLSGFQVKRLERSGDHAMVYYANGLVDVLSHQLRPFSIDRKLMPIQDIAQRKADYDNQTWIACHTGLYLSSNEVLVRVKDSLLGNQEIYSIASADSGGLYASTSQGISFLELEHLKDSTEQWEIKEQRILAHASAVELLKLKGKIWFYAGQQLGYIDVSKPEVDVNYLDLGTKRITSMVPFFDRYLMIATRDQGIFYVSTSAPRELAPLPRNEALPTLQIRSLAVDDENLWISTRNEIFRLRCDLDLSWEEAFRLNRRHGLPRMEFITGDSYVDAAGHVFFAHTEGLLELTAQLPLSSSMGPLLNIQSISVSGNPLLYLPQESKAIEVPFDQNDVTIAMEAVDQNYPLDIQYEWRLEGLSQREEWTVSASNKIDLLSLPPRRYTLSARAKNRAGVYSSIIDQVIIIQRPFWMKGWFIACGMVLLLGGVYLLYRWRIQVATSKSLKKSAQLETQNRVLKLEQSALRLQMNPHFIFNALQSIQSKVMQGEKEQARSDLQSFASLMRSYLDQARMDLINLEEEIKGLQQYLLVEQTLKDAIFDYQFILPKDFDPSFYELPPMLIQPFVENAIKHGLPARSRMGFIQIEFSWQGKYLMCEIVDNGKGFNGKVEDSSHKSAGMQITQKRLETFFQDEEIEPVTMGNRIDENQEIEGAWVKIWLPVHS